MLGSTVVMYSSIRMYYRDRHSKSRHIANNEIMDFMSTRSILVLLIKVVNDGKNGVRVSILKLIQLDLV